MLTTWLQNNIPEVGKLDGKYNHKISLDGEYQSLEVDAAIVNFWRDHPLDFVDDHRSLLKKLVDAGPFEKFCVERCLENYEDYHLDKTTFHSGLSPAPFNNNGNEPVAIVGMSFRMPGNCSTPDEFWDLLITGKDAVRTVPPFRWKREHILNEMYVNRKVEAGFLSCALDEFDAKFFGMSPKEAEFLDPQQRLLHEVAWEAMEDAMLDPHKLRGTQTGVYVGSWIHDYRDIALKSPDVDFFRVYMGNSLGSESARLSHFFQTCGPSIATESGCSSAIVAVHMACKSLQRGETNLAMAAGVNLLVHPFSTETLPYITCPDGRCKTFDADANGFGRAEACAVLLMKRLSDAIRDEDQIMGLIKGSAVTQEGLSKSLGTPTIQCESLAMELALKDAGVRPSQVTYVETHGTGTSVGDPLEVKAITKAYSKNRREPLVIGSVKTNVGHTESVSGLTGIIKVILSMKHEQIPPHLNLKNLNPAINLEAIPAEIPLCPKAWPKNEDKRKPRLAGVSSFGISGTDGHVIIQEPPESRSSSKVDFGMERPLHLMKISAKCPESLDQLVQRYEAIFEENEDQENFADVAYSANTGRATFNHRAVVIAGSNAEALKILKDKSFRSGDVSTNDKHLCFLFTGQGSQYPEMASTLYQTSPVFRTYFDQCSKILEDLYSIQLKDVVWGSSTDKLNRSLYSQTSIFCVEYCLLKMWESWGVKPDFAMGHSLGEFCAAVACSMLDLKDALMLVAERSRLIDSLPQGKMLVIKADRKKVDQLIAKYSEKDPNFWVDYAALNSSDQTVVAGDSELINGFAKFCEEEKLKTILLASTHAFHSRHMDPMLESYRKVATKVKTQKISEDAPKFISGMEGKLVEADNLDATYWVRHTREKVRWIEACKQANEEGCTIFLEVGPHPVLSALVMANIDGAVQCLPSIRRNEKEWTTLLESLSKLYLSGWKGEIDWKGLDKLYPRNKVSLPFYPFNRKSTWTKIRRSPGALHPILGKMVPNASGRSVFEKEMTLKKITWAQEHAIGNTVVFPGAGFLEMCLAGGHSAVQGLTEEFLPPRRPVLLKDLKIKTPLALFDSQLCVLQTIVSLDETDEEEIAYHVEVHRQEDSPDGGGKWISHANSKFLPVCTVPSNCQSVDVNQLISTGTATETKSFYDKLPELGLKFGPKFQSLETCWRSEGGEGLLLRVKVPDDHSSYLIHPVVADAMIQAVMLWKSKENERRKLQVPVQIQEFFWMAGTTLSEEIYIYCSKTEGGEFYATLIDNHGTPLAHMSQVEFAETSVKLVEGMIQQQETAMPTLFEDIWKVAPGPLQNALIGLRHTEAHKVKKDEAMQEMMTKLNDQGEEERHFYFSLVRFTRLYFLNALYKLGWQPEMDKVFTPDNLLVLLSIPEAFRNYCGFFLKSMSHEGLLEMAGTPLSPTFKVIKDLPCPEEINKWIQETITPYFKNRAEFRIIQELGENLAEIISGKAEPLSYLFPVDSSKPTAGEFYEAVGKRYLDAIKEVGRVGILPLMAEASSKSAKPGEKPVVRVLEVGAGTGVFTEGFLQSSYEFNVTHFEYHYTDISGAFAAHADRIFQKTPDQVIFKKFDMEKDPLEQGFCPGYFDIIVGCEVLHVAKDIKKVLKNLRVLLKDGGLIQIAETVEQDPRITFIFGLLDGYWQFEDKQLRPDHATLTIPKWRDTLIDSGFCDVVGVPLYENVHGFVYAFGKDKQEKTEEVQYLGDKEEQSWLILSDNSSLADKLETHLHSMSRRVVTVSKPEGSLTESSAENIIWPCVDQATSGDVKIEGVLYLWGLSTDSEDKDQTRISLPFVTLLQKLGKLGVKPPRVYIVTKGVYSIMDSEVVNPSPAPLVGIGKALANEDPQQSLFHLDLDPEQDCSSQMDEICGMLWASTNKNPVIALRSGKRFSYRIASARVPNENLSIPNGCDRFQLVLPKTRLISDLEFGPLNPFALGDYEIEVQVRAMALNFRDVFTVLKPLQEFVDFNSVGLDFAGVISRVGAKVTKRKIGERVIGMQTDKNLSLPSHLRIEEQLVIPLPEKMTFVEGATLPAVFITVVYSLLHVAKMKPGEVILVHTASGGVGLAAIQLAKHIGVEVIATCGSRRKRRYLEGLGVKHIFNSRTTQFGEQVLEVTSGKGVDIVLNSLTGEGFKEASLSALAEGGRFIELSALGVWQPEEIQAIRPDVFYKIIQLVKMDKHEHEQLTTALSEHLQQDFITPIAYETFDALNIRGALSYLQKARHIGKIVCLMPELKMDNMKIVASTNLFHPESTYLVTGGLGGIGLEVVKWMLKRGAKHLAIASRSPPKPDVEAMIQSWNKNEGKHVRTFAVDIGSWEKCQNLFQELVSENSGFPQLRGVMHAAGVLHDATIQNQSWGTFQHTYNPKIWGTWNLHELTKDMTLEHFVVFSSIAATLGSPGQTNHSGSNSFEDALVHYRSSLGLPGTCVNWGNWGEVGVATEVDLPGVRPISTSQGLLALETFLKTQRSHISVLNTDSFALMVKLFPQLRNYIDDKRLLGETKQTVLINSDDFWAKVDAAEGREEKLAIFLHFIKVTVRSILKMDGDEEIDDLAEFQSLGIDSLMMLEMKNSLQNVLGARMTLTQDQLKDCVTPKALATKLVDVLEGVDAEDDVEVVVPTMEELRQLIRDDSTLPENVCVSSDKEIKELGEVETVLVTGVTGTVGPYLLKEITALEHVKKVYCLMRKNAPSERLYKRLQVTNLDKDVDLAKIECVQGDVAEPKLGLSDNLYDKLAAEVDAVVHGAVRADHTAKYWACPESRKSDVRNVNVKGTLRVLEFASYLQTKHVYHGSSLLLLTKADEEGRLWGDWPGIGDLDEIEINSGYVISKHISEQLVKQAVERGIPCKTFRMGALAGDSRSGRCDPLSNHMVLRWLACMKLKMMPDWVAPLILTPVDHCAKITTQMFFHPEVKPDVYNLTYQDAAVDQSLVEVASEHGIQIELVPFSEFLEKLKQEGNDVNSPMAPFRKRYEEEEGRVDQVCLSVDCLKKYVEDSTNFFKSDKLAHVENPPIDTSYLESTEVVMRRDVQFLKESGIFQRFGINTK